MFTRTLRLQFETLHQALCAPVFLEILQIQYLSLKIQFINSHVFNPASGRESNQFVNYIGAINHRESLWIRRICRNGGERMLMYFVV